MVGWAWPWAVAVGQFDHYGRCRCWHARRRSQHRSLEVVVARRRWPCSVCSEEVVEINVPTARVTRPKGPIPSLVCFLQKHEPHLCTIFDRALPTQILIHLSFLPDEMVSPPSSNALEQTIHNNSQAVPAASTETSSQILSPKDTFTLYDLRVEVVCPPGARIMCGAKEGDHFTLEGEMMHLPPGQGMSIYSIGKNNHLSCCACGILILFPQLLYSLCSPRNSV